MANIFITGSADGLGHLAAKLLIRHGHAVVLHARNTERSKDVRNKIPEAEHVLTADLSNIKETIQLAADVNALGTFDAVIHNAGIYNYGSDDMGIEEFQRKLFTVNTLAPYILTALIRKPKRLIYMSSGMHLQGDPYVKGIDSDTLEIRRSLTYSDTKLHDMMLCLAISRRWPDVFANAVNPGWVPTKMGGAGAPDNIEQGYETQAWLAVSADPAAQVSGRYFYHKKEKPYLPDANNAATQDKLLSLCEKISGVRFPNFEKQ